MRYTSAVSRWARVAALDSVRLGDVCNIHTGYEACTACVCSSLPLPWAQKDAESVSYAVRLGDVADPSQ